MKFTEQKSRIISGVLAFHSETGTEGGYWAFQDQQFITENTTVFVCTKCGLYWDSGDESRKDLPWQTIPPLEGHKFCAPGTHTFELSPPVLWSYEGLHILKDGDVLTIYDKEQTDKVVWQGIVQLINYPCQTEYVRGMWIHADQVGVDRETWATWFLREYPGKLVT